MSQFTPPKVRSLAPSKQRRLDTLLEKNAAGTITPKDRKALQALVDEAEALMVANLERLAEFAKSQSPKPPLAAVPVTVWVNPQPTER
jgi:hypothetical protein